MKPSVFAMLFLLLASTMDLHANAGGYSKGGVERAGDVAGFEPNATENIRILDEKLTVKLGPKLAVVEVRYIMKNITDKKVSVRFGFPVEESFDNDYPMGEGAPMDHATHANQKPAYCRDYQPSAAGKSIKATWQAERRQDKDARFKGLAGWIVSELDFAANEEKPVTIRFNSSYPSSVWGSSCQTSVAAMLFRYRLSTAACWAGTIGSGQIILQPNGINPEKLKVLKPVNRFKRDGLNWVWNFEDLEPTMADDLEIESSPGRISYYGDYSEENGHWMMTHSNYHVKASSTLPPEGTVKFVAANIKGNDNPWCEGAKGPGIGEWLELEPVEPKPLTAISMTPGYARDQKLFEANGRPRKMLVELNGEHRFTVDVPDSRDEVEFPVLNYRKPVKKIRLTFIEVWPGNRFEDLCITHVSLHVRLDKKPVLPPCR